MPIYLDRHRFTNSVSPKDAAQNHLFNLGIQDQYGCKAITYWFDEVRKVAFCLVEAPNREAVSQMHDHTHGGIPNEIIEVDESIVLSFLGRIKAPFNKNNEALKLIEEPSFRFIMALNFHQNNHTLQINKVFLNKIKQLVEKHNGTIVESVKGNFLTIFTSSSSAIDCAKSLVKFSNNNPLNFQIGLSCGNPVDDAQVIFEKVITEAKNLCLASRGGKVVLPSAIKKMYQKGNTPLNIANFKDLKSVDIAFLAKFLSFVSGHWSKSSLKIPDCCTHLRISSSSLHRKMMASLGVSFTVFLREYRLKKSIEVFPKFNSTAEVSYETGFNSPEYFRKCFYDFFGVSPSNYIKQSNLPST
jgi:AraC-like DNA-binding protein